MEKITITRKEDKETYEAVMFCIKARGEPDDCAGSYTELMWLCVEKNQLITTDGHRAHITKVKLPNGLYVYKKAKTTITLEKLNPTKRVKYPNVMAIMPKTYAHKVTVNRKDLLRRCKQAKVIMDTPYNDFGVTLDFNGRLDIKAVNLDIGNMTTHVDLNQPVNPEIKVGMNVRYLIDALTGLKGEKTTIGLQENETQALIFKDHNQTALIMPMRA